MGTRIDRRFDYLRKQTEQEANKVGQEQNDQLQRQAAAQGRLGSGNFNKLQNQQQAALASQKQNAIEGVESQREAALAQSEEADLNRKFATAERLGSQEFAMAAQRQSEGFQEGMWNKQEAVRAKEAHDAAWQAQENFKQQMKMADSQWTKQFKLDKKVSDFNMQMAARAQTMAEKPGMFDQAMGYANPFTPFKKGKDVLGVGGTTGGLIDKGASAGGKIICTEYCRQGWISPEVLRGDLEYASKHISLETRVNYLMWAQYVVPLMQKYPVLLYFMWPITYNWVHYMAWKMGRYHKKPLFGYVVEKSATFVSNIIGRTMRKYRRRSYGRSSLSARA